MLKIHHKLLIGSLFFIIIPLLVLGGVSLHISTTAVSDKVSEQTMQTLKSTDLHVRNAMSEINAFSDIVITSFEVQRLLHEHMSRESIPYVEYDRFYQAAKKLLYSNNRVASFSLYSLNGHVLHMGEQEVMTLPVLKSQSWFEGVVEREGRPFWLGPYENAGLKGSDRQLLTQIRVIKDYYTLHDIGYLVIHVKIDLWESIFFELFQGEPGDTLIVNRDGRILYAQNWQVNGEEWFMPRLRERLAEQPDGGAYIGEWQGQRSLMTYYPSSTGWIFVSVKPWNALSKETGYIRNVTTIMVVLALLLALFFNWFYVRRVAAFVAEFSMSMQKVKLGNLNHEIPTRMRGELGKLAHSYNRMLERIRQLLLDVQREQQRKKEAEFTALQAQINPHFLYNTLESINALASLHGQNEIQRMTQNLGKLLRISIRKTVAVEVREELNHVRSYLEIQKIRYARRFDYRIKADEAMLHYKTLKLVLQPLVENAVYHGFEDLDEGGMITIRAKVENGCGTFYVRDNGRGMPGEVLRKLGESGPGGGEGLGHGLMNVHERLVMYYGKRYGLRICSDADWGTLIQVRFPLNGGDEIEPGSDRG